MKNKNKMSKLEFTKKITLKNELIKSIIFALIFTAIVYISLFELGDLKDAMDSEKISVYFLMFALLISFVVISAFGTVVSFYANYKNKK